MHFPVPDLLSGLLGTLTVNALNCLVCEFDIFSTFDSSFSYCSFSIVENAEFCVSIFCTFWKNSTIANSFGVFLRFRISFFFPMCKSVNPVLSLNWFSKLLRVFAICKQYLNWILKEFRKVISTILTFASVSWPNFSTDHLLLSLRLFPIRLENNLLSAANSFFLFLWFRISFFLPKCKYVNPVLSLNWFSKFLTVLAICKQYFNLTLKEFRKVI